MIDEQTPFEELVEMARADVAQGRGAVNCTYVLAAEGKPYPRTCKRCGLGECVFYRLEPDKVPVDSRLVEPTDTCVPEQTVEELRAVLLAAEALSKSQASVRIDFDGGTEANRLMDLLDTFMAGEHPPRKVTGNAQLLLGFIAGSLVGSHYKVADVNPGAGEMTLTNGDTGTEFVLSVRQTKGPE